MSRIGKQPIPLSSGVKVTLKDNSLNINGPNGALNVELLEGIEVEITDKELNVINRGGETKLYKSRHGLIRSLLANAVKGVTDGFEKKLELHGVGYRVEAKTDGLDLTLGFSHPVFMKFPDGVSAEVDKSNNIITVRGIDKQKVGQYCANVRKLRPPEPYKGKGFRYQGERIRRKSGKKV